MATYSLHKIAQKLSDWRIIIAAIMVVGATVFNSVAAIFNYALITKLAPINEKISAIEYAGKERDSAIDSLKSDESIRYGGLVDKIDGVNNKLDALTLRLIGKVIK